MLIFNVIIIISILLQRKPHRALKWTLYSEHCSEHSTVSTAVNTLQWTLQWTLFSEQCSEHFTVNTAVNTL